MYVQQRGPKPLDLFATSAVNTFGQEHLQNQAHAKENMQIQQAFADVNEDTSPLQILTKISGLNVSPDKKDILARGFQHILKQKEMARKSGQQQQVAEHKQEQEQLQSKKVAQRLGIPEEDVEGLSPKQILDLYKAEKSGSKPGISEKPIDPEQLDLIQKVRSQPGFSELDAVDQYRALTEAGVSRANSETESKLRDLQLQQRGKEVESSYKRHEDFINDTTSTYRGFETEMKPRLLQMQKLATDNELVTPTASVFLDALGIPLGALENPASELYSKLSQDLLKGLPETYGSRILKIEVDNFLKTIPTLLNSPEGRRMIASNMLKLGQMKEIFYNEMRGEQRKYLDENKPLPRDFQQKIFDQVKPQVDKANEEFVKMSEIKFVPKNTVPFFDPNGEIAFIPEEDVEWALEEGGKRIW